MVHHNVQTLKVKVAFQETLLNLSVKKRNWTLRDFYDYESFISDYENKHFQRFVIKYLKCPGSFTREKILMLLPLVMETLTSELLVCSFFYMSGLCSYLIDIFA